MAAIRPTFVYFINLKGLLALILPLLLIACTEQVEIYTDIQPTPVVYCLLNPADSIQYVRIGRSYQASAATENQLPNADSTFWSIPHQVYMEEYANDSKINRYNFEPVMEGGTDSLTPPVASLRLYSSPIKVIPGNAYQLYVYFPDIKQMVSGKITVHGLPRIVDPLPLSIRKINFEQGQPFTIRWYPGLNTAVYQMIFRLHFRDSSASGEEFKQADYSSGGIFDQQTDLLQETHMGGLSFFQAMVQNIPVVPGMVREVISVEFIMISGGTDLGFHYRSGIESGTNFTNFSDYSNLRSGIGVFSSRNELHVPNLTLSEVTIDLLAHGEITRALGFKDSKGNRDEAN
jgi:hypothetical protein